MDALRVIANQRIKLTATRCTLRKEADRPQLIRKHVGQTGKALDTAESLPLKKARSVGLMWIAAIAGSVFGIALLWFVRDSGAWYLDDALVPTLGGILAALGFGIHKLRSLRLVWALVMSCLLSAGLLLVYFAAAEWLVMFAVIFTPVVLTRIYSRLLQTIVSALWRVSLAAFLALASAWVVTGVLFSVGPDWSPSPVAGALAAAGASAIAWEVFLGRLDRGVDGSSAGAASSCPTSAST